MTPERMNEIKAQFELAQKIAAELAAEVMRLQEREAGRDELHTALVNVVRRWGPWDSGNPDHTADGSPEGNLYNAAVRACRRGLIPKLEQEQE